MPRKRPYITRYEIAKVDNLHNQAEPYVLRITHDYQPGITCWYFATYTEARQAIKDIL